MLGVAPVVGAAPQPNAPVEVAAGSVLDVLVSAGRPQSASGVFGTRVAPAPEGRIPDLLTGSGIARPAGLPTDELLRRRAVAPVGSAAPVAADAVRPAMSRTESLLRASVAPTIALAAVGGFLIAAGCAAASPGRVRRSDESGSAQRPLRHPAERLPGSPSVPRDVPAAAPQRTAAAAEPQSAEPEVAPEPEVQILPIGGGIRTGQTVSRPVGPEAAGSAQQGGEATVEWSLPAIAAIGYRELAAQLVAAHPDPATVDDLATIAVAYVRFALDRPGLFQVMFGVGCDPAGADRVDAVAAIQAYLAAIVQRAAPSVDPESTATGVWALVHGLAFLYLDRKLDAAAADAVAERVRAVVTATLAGRRG